MKRRGLWTMGAVLMVLVLLVSACAPAATPTSVPPTAVTQSTQVPPTPAPQPTPTPAGPYKVGVVLSLSGSVAANGISTRDGVLLAEKEINASGGINGRQIQFVVQDDTSSPDQAVVATTKLIEDEKVVGVIGGSAGNLAIAIGGYMEGTHCVFTTQGGKTVQEATFKNAFHMVPDLLSIGRIMAKYAAEVVKAKKVALLRLTREYGQTVAQGVKDSAKDFGLEVVADEQGADADVDFSAQLTKIRAANPDIVLIVFANPAGATIIRQAREMGITVPMAGANALPQQATIDLAGAAAEGFAALGSLVNGDPLPRQKHFLELWRQENGGKDPTSAQQAIGYDMAWMFAKALQKLNGADADCASVRSAFESLQYEGAATVAKFSSTNHDVELESANMQVVKDGVWHVVSAQ